MIPRTIVVVAEGFPPRLGSARVAAALARGLHAGGWEAVECHLREDPDRPPRKAPRASAREALWEDLGLAHARALVIADPDLCSGAPPRGATFEIATRARQGGVPAHAITGIAEPDLFQARMLDLQAVLRARPGSTLEAAAARLAELL